MQTKMKQGFSLMEIMIAVAIIGIMAALVGPGLIRMLSRGKESATKATLASYKSALQDYYQDMGHFPSKAEGGLDALIERPKTDKAGKWEGPYFEGVDALPEDGWGFPFTYNSPPQVYKNKYKRYEVISFGEEQDEEDTKHHYSAGA